MEPTSNKEVALRNENDMCAVHAIQSLLRTANKGQSLPIPDYVWEKRRADLDKGRDMWGKGLTNGKVDDEKEFEWVDSTLKQLQEGNNYPFSITLTKDKTNNIKNLNEAMERGEEVVVFGKDSDQKTPHVYHLGKPIRDIFGDRFESQQQSTQEVDLADFFMRFGECQVAYATTAPK